MSSTMAPKVLDDSVCYLIGPIDFVDDQGVGFRQNIIKQSQSAGLNIKFLDPTNKVSGLPQDVGEEQKRINQYKKTGQWEDLRVMMKKIVRSDLRCIDYSDFVIAYVDTSVHMCGSYHEIAVASDQRKPVLIVVEGGKATAPSWLFGIVSHETIFDSVEELVDHLVELNNAQKPLSDHWVLIRHELTRKHSDTKADSHVELTSRDGVLEWGVDGVRQL